jgi:ketosteroid isomerase-like protein
MTTVAEVVLQAFDAVERRDREGLLALYHPEIEFHEAPSLPERSMDPRVIAANDREVVVLYRQRALSPTGARFDAPVLGLYEVREGKFGRAQMFHFDTLAVVQYLARTTP